VIELGLLDGEQEHRPLPQLERHRPFLLQLLVPAQGLVEELIDPRSGLTEEKPAVPTRRSGPDRTPVDDEDGLSGSREEARRRAAGDAGADDGGVSGA
jgi:hypothetical protein